MKWLDVESVRMVEHAAMFLVTRADAINFNTLLAGLEKYRAGGDIEKLSVMLRDMVVSVRPELKGCQVWSVQFDWNIIGWAIGVEHPSLPAISLGTELPRIYLFDREDAKKFLR